MSRALAPANPPFAEFAYCSAYFRSHFGRALSKPRVFGQVLRRIAVMGCVPMPKRGVAGGFTQGETCKRLQSIQASLVQVTQLAQKSQSILLPSAGMRVVNLRGQGVQLLMKGQIGRASCRGRV